MGNAPPLRTICQVLREIRWTAEDRGEVDIITLIDEATLMAKRMDKKLKSYKQDWSAGKFWRDMTPEEQEATKRAVDKRRGDDGLVDDEARCVPRA